MRKLRIIVLSMFVLLVVAACGDDKKEETKEQDGIGFSLSDDTIEEAANVPEDEKTAILDVFNTYIETSNEKDIDKYMDTIAEKPDSFDKAEEKTYLETEWEDKDIIREPSDITIVNFNEEKKEAQVYANINNKVKQLSTGLETSIQSRQVTVFKQEEGNWKVSAVHVTAKD